MAKPLALNHLIAQRLTLEQIADLCAEIGFDIENLGGQGKRGKARELVSRAEMQRRTAVLLETLPHYLPDLDVTPYLFMLIYERLDAAEVAAVCRQLGLDCAALGLDESGLAGYDYQRYIRQEKALALQEAAQQAGRFPQLVAALEQIDTRPPLELSVFVAESEPAAPPPTAKATTSISAETVRQAREQEQDIFDLHIGWRPDDQGDYPVSVTDSTSGQTRRPVWQTAPLGDPEFERLLDSLAELRAGQDDLKRLGRRLWQMLLPDELAAMLRTSRALATRDGKSLRIRLRIDPPELSRLPWEYCYGDEAGFLALDRRVPLVRYPAESFSAGDQDAPVPINVLLAMASPSDLDPLDLAAAEESVRASLAPLDDRVRLQVVHPATPRALQQELFRGDYHVLHFVGHGGIRRSGQGALALEDQQGGIQLVDADRLRVLLQGSAVKLAVLNACHSAAHSERDALMGVAPALVRAGIPAVMAMQFKVYESTARLFSEILYAAMAAGMPVDAAVSEMRIGAFAGTDDHLSWGIPVLYLRAEKGAIW